MDEPKDEVSVDKTRQVLAAFTTAANALQELAPQDRRRALEALHALYGDPSPGVLAGTLIGGHSR